MVRHINVAERKRIEEERLRKEEEARKKREAVVTPPTPTPTPTTYTDPKTGKETGFEYEGKTYYGLSPSEKELFLQQQEEKKAQFPLTKGLQQQEEQARFTEILTANLGAIQPTGDVERDKISYEQAWKSALADAGIGAAAGAAVSGTALGIGAAAAPATGGISLAAGATIAAGVTAATAIGAFIRAMDKNIEGQRSDIITGEAQNLRKHEANLLRTIMNVNKAKTVEEFTKLREQFDATLSLADQDYTRLKMETDDDLTLWLGQDGHPQLEKYYTFNAVGGTRDGLVFSMKQAIENPDVLNNLALQAQVDVLEAQT